jgi:hypothetical protein
MSAPQNPEPTPNRTRQRLRAICWFILMLIVDYGIDQLPPLF